MSDMTNMHITESSKTSANSASSTGKAGLQGATAIESAGSATDEGSFQESMSKAIEETTADKNTLNAEHDGNDLPVSDDLMLATAEDDRLPDDNIIVPGLSFSENNLKVLAGSAQSASAIDISEETILDSSLKTPKVLPTALQAQTNSVAVDGVLNNDAKASLLSSPIRQLLQADTKLQNNKIQDINNALVTASSDNALSRSSEMPQIKLEGFDFFNQKNSMLAQQSGLSGTELSTQLHTAADLQSTLLSRSSVLSTDSLNILSTATMPSAATSTSSTGLLSLQSLPQVDISEQFGRSGWAQGMGKQITWLANQNIKSAEIRLNPAHLGPIEVKLDISDDQINVALSSRHAAVREAMEMALPKLREMLDSNGLNLSDADISQHSFAEQREQNTTDGSGQRFSDNSEHSDLPVAEVDVMQQAQLSTAVVDYYI